MYSIAVLLTCYNRREKTLSCLDAFYNAIQPEDVTFELFLVDDGSTDETAESVHEHFPDVNIIKGSGDLYWNKGMRLAWEKAAKVKEYDFFLWINDDTIINHNALNILLETSKKFDNKCNIIGTTSSITNSQTITYGGWDKNTGLITNGSKSVNCDFFNGNLVLIPKCVYEIVGMNDPVFRHALGDFDYGLRSKEKNIQSVIAPGILGKCDLHESLPTWCNPQKPFILRWKAFRTPLGQNPEEFFVFEKRHNGIFKAYFHYFTNHLRVVFPSLWLTKH